MTTSARTLPASPFSPLPVPVPGKRTRFGEQAPPLPSGRARVVSTVHAVGSVLATAYLLWANYVVFTGANAGNAPLTGWHVSDGSAGAGTFMLFIGNWLLLLAFQLAVNGPLDFLLTGLLQPARDAGATFHPVPPVPPAGIIPAVRPLDARHPRGSAAGMPTTVMARRQGRGPSSYPEWRNPERRGV